MNQAVFWIATSFVWAWTYTLGFNQMGGQANIYGAVISLGFGLIAALLSKVVFEFGSPAVWFFLIIILPINVGAAFDQKDAALRWAYFLLLLKLAYSFTQNKPGAFYRGFTVWLPIALIIVMLADLYARRQGSALYDDSAKGAGHAITLYATLLAALAPFGRKFRWTLLLWGFSILFIYFSGSRGALFSLAPVFAVAFFYYVFAGLRAQAALVLVGLGLAAIMGPVILDFFGQIKVANPNKISSWDSAVASLEARIQLARNAWDLVMQKPITGWGNGQSYNRVQGLYESAAVHSIWVITLLQFGLPMGIAINIFVLSVPFRFVISKDLPLDLRWMAASVYAGYFFRATFEPISFFDLGSMWSFAHLVLFAYATNLLSRGRSAYSGLGPAQVRL
jgi:O-antigen ligase